MIVKRNKSTKKQIAELYNTSYLPIDVVNSIKGSYELLRFCSWLPHWFQRRIVDVNPTLTL